jgi:hypothetical protein
MQEETTMKLIALILILLVAALAGLEMVTANLGPRDAAGQSPPMRFDEVVRDDFFAGFRGDSARLAQGMKRCEEELAKNPRHAQALVWHGSGLSFQAGEASRRGDLVAASELSQRGHREMNEAVALAPTDAVVLILRAVTLTAASRALRDPARARAALETAVGDFESTLRIQAPIFKDLPEHPRGELLGGLADGWYRLGNEDRARRYLARIVAEVPGSTYADAAQRWLEHTPLRGGPGLTCLGCHE